MNDVLHRLRLSQVEQPDAWDDYVARNKGHLLQSYAWGELKTRFGWQAERLALGDGPQVRCGAQVLYRRLLPGLTIAYVPRGPVQLNGEFLDALIDAVRSKGAFALKLEPDWPRGDERERALRQAGFRPTPDTIQPAATIRIDLTRKLDQILAGMKSKWRYNIRLAEKKGVTVRAGTAADIPAFYALSRITSARDQFGIHPEHYYRTAFELLTACDAARLLIAEYEGETLAAIFVAAFGHEAIYLYGASGNAHRNVMPNHALHWAAIQWAKTRGCEWYDLWGVPEDVESDDERLPSSLYQFKQGFGGEVVHYTGAWDAVFFPAANRLYRAARRLRRSGLG